ncbi:hypothetical protein TKK_0011011 [Trichogramma kaykai]
MEVQHPPSCDSIIGCFASMWSAENNNSNKDNPNSTIVTNNNNHYNNYNSYHNFNNNNNHSNSSCFSHDARLSYPRAQQMDQRWPEVTPFYSQSTNHGNNEHYSHHLSHHVTSQVYEPVNVTHHGYDHIGAARNVILNNATLAPPVGDLNSTGSYHNAGASNLGSAVATSMNLTNSSEPMSAESNTNYKAEPTDLMYYQNNGTHNVSMNQNPDSSMFSNLLDDPINWNNEDLNFNMTDGKYSSE